MEGCAGYPTAQPLIFNAQFLIRNSNLIIPGLRRNYNPMLRFL